KNLKPLILRENRLLERGGFGCAARTNARDDTRWVTRTRVVPVHEVGAAKARPWASTLSTPGPLSGRSSQVLHDLQDRRVTASEARGRPRRTALDHVRTLADAADPVPVLGQAFERPFGTLVVHPELGRYHFATDDGRRVGPVEVNQDHPQVILDPHRRRSRSCH